MSYGPQKWCVKERQIISQTGIPIATCQENLYGGYEGACKRAEQIVHEHNNFQPLLIAATNFLSAQRELAICAERKGFICLSCEGRDRCSLREKCFQTRNELFIIIEGEKNEEGSGA